jgi:hypothetical protein
MRRTASGRYVTNSPCPIRSAGSAGSAAAKFTLSYSRQRAAALVPLERLLCKRRSPCLDPYIHSEAQKLQFVRRKVFFGVAVLCRVAGAVRLDG